MAMVARPLGLASALAQHAGCRNAEIQEQPIVRAPGQQLIHSLHPDCPLPLDLAALASGGHLLRGLKALVRQYMEQEMEQEEEGANGVIWEVEAGPAARALYSLVGCVQYPPGVRMSPLARLLLLRGDDEPLDMWEAGQGQEKGQEKEQEKGQEQGQAGQQGLGERHAPEKGQGQAGQGQRGGQGLREGQGQTGQGQDKGQGQGQTGPGQGVREDQGLREPAGKAGRTSGWPAARTVWRGPGGMGQGQGEAGLGLVAHMDTCAAPQQPH